MRPAATTASIWASANDARGFGAPDAVPVATRTTAASEMARRRAMALVSAPRTTLEGYSGRRATRLASSSRHCSSQRSWPACGAGPDDEATVATPTVSEAAPSEPGREPAPAIEGVSLDGDPISLADFRGRPVLINVWSSW